jgi:hypothetical protein
MHELDPLSDEQQYDLGAAAFLSDQATTLREQDPSLGVEGFDADEVAGSAHDPATEIDTVEIGCGDDLDAPEPADSETATAIPDSDERLVAESAGAVAVAAEHSAEPAESVDTAKANDTSEPDDTSLPLREALDNFEQCERGETVQSGAAAVADFEATSDERAALGQIAARENYYVTITPDKLFAEHPRPDRTGMSRPQLETVAKMAQRFVAAANADAAANGYGEVDRSTVRARVGHFAPGSDSLNWHVDLYDQPTARYVLSLGDVGATHFAEGPVNRDQVRDVTVNKNLNTGPDGTHQDVTHGIGVISRFFGNYVLHRTPDEAGFRVFFTANVPLQEEL